MIFRTTLWGDGYDDDDISNVSKNKEHATCLDGAGYPGLESELPEAVRAFRRERLQEYMYEDLVPESKRVKFGKATHTVSLGSDPSSIIGFL